MVIVKFTPNLAPINWEPIDQHGPQSAAVVTPLPAKLPREARFSTAEDMEPHECRYVRLREFYVDMQERVWLNAEAYTSRIEGGDYIARIRRTEHGVTLDLPKGYGYAPARKCPFDAVLPVLGIEIVDTDDFDEDEE